MGKSKNLKFFKIFNNIGSHDVLKKKLPKSAKTPLIPVFFDSPCICMYNNRYNLYIVKVYDGGQGWNWPVSDLKEKPDPNIKKKKPRSETDPRITSGSYRIRNPASRTTGGFEGGTYHCPPDIHPKPKGLIFGRTAKLAGREFFTSYYLLVRTYTYILYDQKVLAHFISQVKLL